MQKIDNTKAIKLLDNLSKREILELCDEIGFKYNDDDNWIETYWRLIESLEKWEYDINFIL